MVAVVGWGRVFVSEVEATAVLDDLGDADADAVERTGVGLEGGDVFVVVVVDSVFGYDVVGVGVSSSSVTVVVRMLIVD